MSSYCSTSPSADFFEALYQGELEKLQQAIITLGDGNEVVMNLVRELQKSCSPTDLQCHARRVSWRDGTFTRSAIVVQLTLVRARRSLYLSTSDKIPCLVYEHLENSTVRQTAESPKLLLRQIGRIASTPMHCAPPPLFASNF
jgi:hypothetical protein